MNVVKADISVIIVSYNVQKYLCNSIDSILAQNNINVEIIVIDNGSTDGTKELISTKYPSVKLILNSDNVGFSAANNRGLKEASSETIMLLNPDTELAGTDMLQSAKKYLESNPQIAILAPHLLNEDGSFQPSFWNGKGIKELALELFYLHRIKKAKEPSSPMAVKAASGAALIFRKSLIDEIGGLDENMFWMEDVDFCYRANKTGKIIMWHPGFKVVHLGGKSSAGNKSVTIPNQVISKIKFSKKHDSKPVYYVVNIISLLYIISRLLIFTLLSPFIQACNEKRKAYIVALKSYFRLNFYGNRSIIK